MAKPLAQVSHKLTHTAQQVKALRRWMLGGIAAGLLYAVVAYAPAAWLVQLLTNASGGAVLLQEPRGTVWSGSAGLTLLGGEGSQGAVSLPARLSWRISPVWLGADVQLDSTCCTPSSPITLELRVSDLLTQPHLTWQLTVAQLAVPAQLLTGLGAPWNTLQLAGELMLTSEQWSGSWSPAQGLYDLSGRASLQAVDVATALATVKPLGSYRLSVTAAQLKLETLERLPTPAALILAGAGRVEGGRISFQGEAQAAKGYEEALSNLLHIVGQWQPSTDGRSRSILKI